MPLTNSTGGLPAGIDLRGDGGYALAPEAILPDGRRYSPFKIYPSLIASLKLGTTPVVPASLVKVIKRDRKKARSQGGSSAPSDRADGDFSRESIHARGLLDLHAEKLAKATQGSRNEALNAIAYLLGRMVGPGWISADLVRQRLLAASEVNGSVADDGLDKAKDTIERGLAAGIAKPRTTLPKEASTSGPDTAALAERIAPTPFEYVDPALLPRRDWIYNFYYIGKFITATVAPGGTGKTSLGMAEAIAIATGRDLLGVLPKRRVKVWYWNGEDPKDELERRVAGIMLHYRIDPREIEDWLFLDTGRTMPIKLATQEKSKTQIAKPVVEKLIAVIKDLGIGLMIIDPFVSSHQVTENDNNAIAAVALSWSRIADATGCAIELVHHARKTGGNEIGVEDGRGASALAAAARGMRVLNGMTKDEAEQAAIPEEDRRLYFRVEKGKSNLSRPATGAEWYKMESVSLGNGPDLENPDREADSVAVVTTYEYVEVGLEVTPEQEKQICKLLSDEKSRLDVRSPNWAGNQITVLLESQHVNNVSKTAVKALIDELIKRNILAVFKRNDDKGRPRDFIRLGKNSPLM